MKAIARRIKLGEFELTGLMSESGEFGMSLVDFNGLLRFEVESCNLKPINRHFPDSTINLVNWEVNGKPVRVLKSYDVDNLLWGLSMASNKIAQDILDVLNDTTITYILRRSFTPKI